MKKFLFVALLAMIVVAGSADAAYVGVLTKNLKQGMTDAEVTLLQQGLAQDAIVYPAGLVTGYFGPLTKAAVIKFQEKFASERGFPNSNPNSNRNPDSNSRNWS